MGLDTNIVGVGYSDPDTFTDHRESRTHKETMGYQAVSSALEHAGIGIDDLDATVFTSVDGFEGTNRIERTMETFGQDTNTPLLSVNTGGTGGGSAFKAGYELVSSGMHDLVLVYGSSTWDSAVDAQQILNTAAPPLYEKPFIAAAHMGAFYGTGYMEKHGATEEDFARAAAKNYQAAANNPYAHRREPYTVEDVLDSPMVVSPLRLLGTCPVSGGSVALVLASKETAQELTDTSVHVEDIDTISNTYLTGYREYQGFEKLDKLADRVYGRTDVEDPLSEFDVAELFNPYIPFEPIEYDALGFCEPGGGPELLREGVTDMDGELPVNPSGGPLCTNPGIAASVARHAEVALQIMGEAGDRQIDDVERGIAHSWGGNDGQFHSLAVLSRD
ncbi:thiolase family protein [Natronomonas marina]|uniref:thiolase family protein n=1 Tax=Natronomonas marina TaxID=2961939 RepID=UPI0020C99AB9|nr:thiolase family protein [Natronomonas marina]